MTIWLECRECGQAVLATLAVIATDEPGTVTHAPGACPPPKDPVQPELGEGA